MHFSNLLCHASMHSWKDSSEIARSSLVTAVLWLLSLENEFLEFEKKKNSQEADLKSRVVAPVQQCYFWQETPEFPGHYELEHCHDEAAMTSFINKTLTVFFLLISASLSE